MRTLKTTFGILFLLLQSLAGYSQNFRIDTLEENTDLFHGTWVATQGSREYELILERGKFTHNVDDEIVYIWEKVWGKLTVRENGVIIKETPEISFYSVISSSKVINPNHILFWYIILEQERFMGRFDFIIDEKDNTKATWKLHPKERGSKGDYDIPDGLTFRKVE